MNTQEQIEYDPNIKPWDSPYEINGSGKVIWDQKQLDSMKAAWYPFDVVNQSTGKTIKEIYYRCPNCKLSGLLKQHAIDQNGVLSPSILCYCPKSLPYLKEKDWHVLGKLLRWSEIIGSDCKKLAGINIGE